MKYLLFLLIPVAFMSCKKKHEPVVGLQEVSSLDQMNTEISNGVSMIFFHASWCHICQNQRPAVTSTAQDTDLSPVYFGEVEYDDFPEILEEYDIDGFPTIVIYVDGNEVERHIGGGHTFSELKSAIQTYI